jgi:hypothetical protein
MTGGILYDMAGRPRGSAPVTQIVQFRATPAEAAVLDEMRGSTTRSAFLRRLVAEEQTRRTGIERRVAAPPAVREAVVQAPIHAAHANGIDGQPHPVADTPLPAHRHKRAKEPYRWEQRGYGRTPVYRCEGWPDCDKELTG